MLGLGNPKPLPRAIPDTSFWRVWPLKQVETATAGQVPVMC